MVAVIYVYIKLKTQCLPICHYVMFQYFLLQICLSVVCNIRASYSPTQPVEIFSNVSMPFCTLAIR